MEDSRQVRRSKWRTTSRQSVRIGRFAKWFDPSWKQQNVQWRNKSIWPDGKVAKPGRMG